MIFILFDNFITMKIKKRDGRLEQLSIDKIIYRLKKLKNDVSLGKLTTIDTDPIALKVVSSIYDGVSSSELDEETARISISMTENLEYAKLASRIIISNLHKNTSECFSDNMEKLYNNIDSNGVHAPVLSDSGIEFIRQHKDIINETCDYTRDYLFDYFGFKTLEKSYLMKLNGKVIERPQHLYMRVAIQVNLGDIDNVIKTYNIISQHFLTLASPTMFNSLGRLGNLSSCFLLGTNDSVDGIFKTMSDVAQISKVGGGIGIHIDNIRSKGSIIRGTNGHSDGIIPMLKVYNEISTYINQSGKRKGSFAIYLSPSHPDILEFLDLRKNQGSESLRARDLFYAMWIPDLFMEQLKIDGDWYLMDPDECPGLNDNYGENYEKLYWKYVEEKKYRKQIKAQEIWVKILESQIETGNPYILYKDQINKKSNQKNIGVIKSSNLCAEITLYSDNKEYAVCNLSSVALPKFIKTDKDHKKYFDHQELFEIVRYLVLPMNNVIDFNYYPVPETKLSNLRHRPIGIGTQGWSLVLTTLGIPFESEQADKLNKEIWETMYFASLTGSMELSKKDGPYETFKGSPLSEGKFQFDLWTEYNNIDPGLSGRWDWETLRQEIITHGVRNSTLLSQMPTASSASIMNNTESVECFDSCIYKRRVLSGEYVVCNKNLVKDLTDLNLWNKELKDLIIANNGSVQHIDIIPQNIKDIYKTVWEISMKSVINQAASRGAFICQTQSMNLFVSAPTIKKLSSMHMYAYSKHLKTGMYYLRSKSAANSAKFSIDPKLKDTKDKKTRKSAKKQEPSAEEVLMCSINNREACDLCTS
jgi:ribonucleoside-diphosphate reductase alpha chain